MWRNLPGAPKEWSLSSNMHVSIEGIDELVADMNKVTQQAFGEAVQGAVKLNGSEMQQEAKRVVRVDTGDLKRSIQLDIADNGFTAIIEPNMHYRTKQHWFTRWKQRLFNRPKTVEVF